MEEVERIINLEDINKEMLLASVTDEQAENIRSIQEKINKQKENLYIN